MPEEYHMQHIKERKEISEHIRRACEIYKNYPVPKPNKIHTAMRYNEIVSLGRERGDICCPTPQEVDDADTVQFEWMPLLDMDDRQLVWKRFSGMGWKRLAKEIKVCERTVRNRVNKSIDRLYYLLH